MSKGPMYMSEKIILASTVFYLWIIMFKITYFEHPSEGKDKAAGPSEDTSERSYAIYILYMRQKYVGRFVLFHHQMYSLNLYSELMPSFKKNPSEGAHHYWAKSCFQGLIASNSNYSGNLK